MQSTELWPGVGVRWIGPERRRGGVRLRPGARAVVVDPGRHGLPSVTSLYHLEGQRPPRPRRGVVIRLVDGPTLTVPRRHLELLAPEHPLRPAPDAGASAWFVDSLEPWGAGSVRVASLVPREFAAVVRVLHPWRVEGELDPGTAASLVEVLGGFTATPDDVYVAVWVGWGDVPPQRFPGAAQVETEHREHFLLRGPLDGVLTSIAVAGRDRPVSGIWWPADRAWFVVTEIDFEWTFVGGSEALTETLMRHPELEVIRSRPDNPAHVLEASP